MKKPFLILCLAAAFTANAQDNLCWGDGVTIHPLGEFKTWYQNGTDNTFTVEQANLDKIIAQPTNKDNIFLFPETGGGWDTPANHEIGIQGFYIDFGTPTSVGIVSTTWEGAAADAFEIYFTDSEPTIAILDTEPTYQASGLGQYGENTAVMPDGTRGRYLVFQPTNATNWGWGVKIRSLSATAPADDILTSFTVTPGIVSLGQAVPVTFSCLNQFGVNIDLDRVVLAVSGDGDVNFENGSLTIVSGTYAQFTATMNDESLTATVYAASAPVVPDVTSIKTPVFSNGMTDYNDDVEWTTGYNGGATNNGTITFENGTVAQSFGNTRCVFFSNKTTTGAWNGNINPSANGYRNLCLDVFSAKAVQCYIEFESVENLEGGHTYYFDLNAGEWNSLTVDVLGATKLNNMSIRFTEANIDDILLTNIYFSPVYIEGDEEAPVLSDITAVPSMTSIALSFSATDNANDNISYSITVGDKVYGTSGKSGETVEYTVTGLQPNTEYQISVAASDGLNVCDPKTVTVTTTGMPDSPELTGEDFDLLYSSWMNSEMPLFDSWGSSGKMSALETSNGNTVLGFSNYDGQWGGLIDLNIKLSEASVYLNIDVFTDGNSGSFKLAPVWAGANGATTPGTTIAVETGKWKTYQIPLDTFGFGNYGDSVIQLSFSESTLSSFAVDNIYFSPKADTGVEAVTVEDAATVNVVNLQGVVLRSNVAREDALRGLPAGLYIVGGKKILVK